MKKSVSRSITIPTLNQNGEIESKLFTEDECYKPTITQGWRIMYALNYDEVFMEMSSKTDKLVFLEVRDSFKKDRKEVSFNQTEMAKKLKSTRQTVNKIFKRLEKIDCLLKLDNGSYRLNPYCYIPFAADGVKLQKEWDELTSNETMKEIIDSIKSKNNQINRNPNVNENTYTPTKGKQ